MPGMNKDLIDRVIADLNALIIDEISNPKPEPGNYKRVIKLSAYAERIRQMDNMRVAGMTDRHGRPFAPRHMVGGNLMDAGEYDPMIDDALQEEGGPRAYPLMGGLGGFQQPNDMMDLVREQVMAQRAPKPQTAGDLASDLQALLDLKSRSIKEHVESPDADPSFERRMAAIRDNIERVTQLLEQTSKKEPHVDQSLVGSKFLRRHPDRPGIGGELHPDRGEAHAPGANGAPPARAEDAPEGLDQH